MTKYDGKTASFMDCFEVKWLYADDLMIFCKSTRAAERTLRNIITFIENELLLRVNKGKTVVDYVGKVKFLGMSFYCGAN